MANETTTETGAVGLPAGTKIGKYEVKERIAMGGQSVVYKCFDPVLDRYVAIKQVSTHLAGDPKFLARFRKEAQILAKMGADQPAIIMIHDLVEDERGLFIVMEHVPGPTLEMVLADSPGPIEPKAVLQVLWRLAAALHDVHKAGIIHRDIKPSNIIIAEGLRPKITDFGVAASITGQTSMVLGTTKYMAPELYSGGSVDGRADMYSLGFVAYELLVGRPKFNEIFAEVVRDKHSEALRWMKWHGNETVVAPRVREINPAVPENLSNIVAKMTAKKPEDRFENMEALGRAIKVTFSPRAKAGPAGASMPRQHRAKVAVAASNALAGVAAAPSIGRMDEGDELELAPATAPLPKKRVSKKAKLIALCGLAVSMIVAGVIFKVKTGNATEERQRQARVMFQDAEKLFKEPNYVAAIPKLEAVRDKYGEFPEADKARVLIHLCNAGIIVADANMDIGLAGDQIAEARNKAKNILRTWQGQALDVWSRDQLAAADVLDADRSTTQKFREAMKTARNFAADGKFDESRSRLSDMLAGLTLSDSQRKEYNRFTMDLKIRQFNASVTQHVAAGDDAASKTDSAAALKEYDAALAMLNSDEAHFPSGGADVLSEAERKDLETARQKSVVDIKKKVSQIGLEDRLKDLQRQLDEAKTADEKINLMKQLDELKPDPKWAEEIKKLLLAADLDKVLAAAKAGDAMLAMSLAEDYLKKDPDNSVVKEILSSMQSKAQRQKLINEGDALRASGKFDEAVAAYKRAAEIPTEGEDSVPKKIKECSFSKVKQEADRLAAAGKVAEAVAQYKVAMGIDPDQAAALAVIVQALESQDKYRSLIAAGDELLKQKKFDEAMNSYKQARRLLPPSDDAGKTLVQSKLDGVEYYRNLGTGMDLMDAKKAKEASGYFDLARGYAVKAGIDTKEVEEWIKKAKAEAAN